MYLRHTIHGYMKNYKIEYVPENQLIIDGESNHELWENAHVLSEFYSPWEPEEIKKIEFRALYDSNNFYFSFKVYDHELYIDLKDNTVESIGNSDRVELFFRADSKLNPYYCLEIDPQVRIMDFKALPNKNFDFDWNWPKGHIDVKSAIETTHFSVEGAISLSSLRELGLLNGNRLEVGVFRAKYTKTEKGDYEPTWITWVDPQTPEPNFHIASSFGSMELKYKKR